jgi:hypothetical protein
LSVSDGKKLKWLAKSLSIALPTYMPFQKAKIIAGDKS